VISANLSEMESQEGDNLWREIVDSLTVALVVVSPDRRVIAINAAAENVLGISRLRRSQFESVLRRNEWLVAMVNRCLTSGQSLHYPETGLLLPHREVLVRAEVSPLTTQAGETTGVVILLQDLSYQQMAEPALRGEPETLRLSSVGLAHEVKNPLTGIKGAAELIAAMLPADPRAQQYCSLIQDGVQRIASLLEEVLAVSGPLRLRTEPVNIHQVLHQALRMAGAYPVPPEGVIVEQLFDPSLPEVMGDAAALERVFLNLIRNSLEAIAAVADSAAQDTSSSGHRGLAQPCRKLILKTGFESQVRMNTQGRRLQFLRVEISDSGKGMTPEEFQQLFTPFFTTKPSGTGLGLVLSRQIIAQHGGRLWARLGSANRSATRSRDEQPTKGMTFCVTLPIRSD
jgi:two-component system nitrogen regulation sensor histidine kinase GlnL